MSVAPQYTYTPEQVTVAFNEIKATLFSGITAEATPKILVVAGLQGSGKTYLLEKTLLPSNRYNNYVRLYLPDYRKKHPQYTEMIKHGVLHAYEHTEAFVREVSTKIYKQAFSGKFNIIMECAFDSLDFAAFPPSATAAGYQFETHIVGCTQAFAHVSSIKRALKSLEDQEMERFLTVSTLDASMSYAPAIILVICVAYKLSSLGTRVPLWRGFLFLSFALIAMNAKHAASFAAARHNDGSGFASRAWAGSKTIAYLKNSSEVRTTYSNGIDAVYFLTKKEALRIPAKIDPTTGKSNLDFEREINSMRFELLQNRAVLVYLDKITWRWYLPTKDELNNVYKLPVLFQLDDGTIYGIE